MSHKLTVSDDQRYIISTVTGDLTSEIADQQMADLYKLANEVGIKNFLIDLVECRFVGSTIEQYEYASSDVPDYGYVNRGDRFAFLVHPDDHSHDFVETVSRNSGYDVTLFRDRAKAINYLLG
jgi:hypothetical protein